MNFYEDLTQRAKNDYRWEIEKFLYDSTMTLLNERLKEEDHPMKIFCITNERLKLQRMLVETLREGEQDAK